MTQENPVQTGSKNNSDLGTKLQAVLDQGREEIRRQARDFASRFGQTPEDISREQHREKTLEFVKAMGAEGFGAMAFPTEYGGSDKQEEFLNFVEVLSHGDLSNIIKQGVHYGLFGGSIAALGTKKHHEKYLQDMINVDLPGGFGMTEIGGGSNVQGLQTTALYDHETKSFIINTPNECAKKAYIGNAALHGELMVVFAQLHMDKDSESEGVHAFLVPVRDPETGNTLPGVTIEDHGKKIGLNGVDNGTLHFDHVSIPADNLLDRFASVDAKGNYTSPIEKKSTRFFKMIGALVMGRIFLSVSSLSAAKNALTHSITAAANREVFGDTLLDLQSTQSLLFPRLAEAYATHFITRDLINNSRNIGSRDLETDAAIIKARTTDYAFQTVDEARRKMGGEGYIAKYHYGSMRNDLDIYRTFEGDNTVLRLFVAKNLLDELANEFRGASTWTKAKGWLSAEFSNVATRFNPAKYSTSAEALLSEDFYLPLTQKREKTMRMNLGKNIMKLRKEAGDSKSAFNLCQDEAVALADAYADSIMLQKFVEVLNAQKDPDVKAALKNLCDLFAITNIQKNADWYLKNGYMSGGQAKAIDDLAHDIQRRIKNNALDLIEGFGIPKDLIADAPVINLQRHVPKPI